MINSDLQPYLDKLRAHEAKFTMFSGHGFGRLKLESFALENRSPLPDGVVVTEQSIPYNDGSLRVLRFQPAGSGLMPAVLYLHGGAFKEGSPETHFDITAQIASSVEAVVISLDYSLAPENPFPAAVHECEACLDWMFTKSETLGINSNKIALWGDSAGANLAAVTAQNRVDKTPSLVAQVLHYPILDFDRSRPSYKENADGPIIEVGMMDYIDSLYCPDSQTRLHPDAAPLLAKEFSTIPASYIAVAEHDPLRDDGYAYAEKLLAAGVETVIDPGEGLIHSYLRAVPVSRSAAVAFNKSMSWLKAQLH